MKVNKSKSNKKHNSTLQKLTNHFRNNTDLIKSVLSFLLAIGLIIVLYYVYKHYNTKNIEGFNQKQEPYDLLDKLKSNIYKLNPIWDNQLFREQPKTNEMPLSFWDITIQDSNYKSIGQAVNNTVNTIKNNIPVAPKDKTMLINGDTRPPTSSKLIYQSPDNFITTKEKNLITNNIDFKQEMLNISSIKDIDERLALLKSIYSDLQANKQTFSNYIDDAITKALRNVRLSTDIYSQNNYFKNPTYSINFNTNNKVIKSPEGDFHGVSLPLGFNHNLQFANNVKFSYKSSFGDILDDSGMYFAKLSPDIIFRNNDQNIFNSSNFNIFGPLGLTRALSEKHTNVPLNFVSRIHDRPGYGHKDKSTSMAFNYMISNEENYGDGFSGDGKASLFDYLDDVELNKDERAKYISDYQPQKLYIYDVKDKDIKILFNEKPELPFDIDPIFGESDNTQRHYKSTSIGVELKEGFVNSYEGNITEINNPFISIKKDVYKVNLKLNHFDDFINKIKNLKQYEWANDITNFDLLDINSNNIGNRIYDFVSYNSSTRELDISMGHPYINLAFKMPIYAYQGAMHIKRKTTGGKTYRQSFKIDDNFYLGKRQRNNAKISFNTERIGFQDVHNIPSIKDQTLKFVESDFTIRNNTSLPITNIINYFKAEILNRINNTEAQIIQKSKSLNLLKDTINANNYRHYPMKIYRPIAPEKYRAVGDLIFAQTSNFGIINSNFTDDEPDLSRYACVPEQCVKDVRNWLPVDKIYERQDGDKYLAIFKNPYLQTFRAVMTPGTLPPGKVEKIVACVERCKLVDEIIQADKCAKSFYKSHKHITDTFNLDPDNNINERRNNIYKGQIADRQDKINTLKERARRLQIQDDKANMINKEYNRSKLQNLVDMQNINMHKLVDNLEKGKNKIVITTKFNYDTLFDLCATGKLPAEVCNIVKQIEIPSPDLSEADRLQADIKAVSALLDSCPTPESEGLVKRTLVENNCGCYFTDDELMNP